MLAPFRQKKQQIWIEFHIERGKLALMQIWCQFRIKIKKIAAEIASSNVAIWKEFSEKRSQKVSKKAPDLELD